MSLPYVMIDEPPLEVAEITATANAVTTSTNDALLTAMTVTPVAGTYLVFFNTDINTNVAGAAVTFSFYLGGAQIGATQRKIIPYAGGTLSSGAARAMACLQALITVNGSQAIEVMWSVSSGTATAASRSLMRMRVG